MLSAPQYVTNRQAPVHIGTIFLGAIANGQENKRLPKSENSLVGSNSISFAKVRHPTLYDSFATVGEIRVYRRADFQSGYENNAARVLKKVF